VRAAVPRTAGRRIVSVVLLVLLGAMTGTAVDQVRDRAAASVGVRTELVAEVEATTRQSDALVAEAAALRAQVTRTREAALGTDVRGRTAAEQVAALALGAGAVPVTGPGSSSRSTTRPQSRTGSSAREVGAPSSGGSPTGSCRRPVNGMWAVGAEAMTVNGVRLTAPHPGAQRRRGRPRGLPAAQPLPTSCGRSVTPSAWSSTCSTARSDGPSSGWRSRGLRLRRRAG
jgi:uncharacterized protein YlxW (UPF0749 family)